MKNLLVFLSFLCCSALFAQQYQYVDVIEANGNITIQPEKKLVYGAVKYEFKIEQSIDSVVIDAQNMTDIEVQRYLQDVDYSYDGKRIVIRDSFEVGKRYTYAIGFSTNPKKAMYFVGWDNEAPNQVWTQGQGKYTSNWLPSFDDMNEKLIWRMNYRIPEGYSCIANGELEYNDIYTDTAENQWQNWYYEMKQPMSSYLLAVVIGDYNVDKDFSDSGVPLYKYYYPKDSLKVEPTYRYTKEIFDYLETEIGVSYPWQNYKQVPVHDFLYAGMENTGATIFSDEYMISSNAFDDKNYVNINAHEMAHQWFGNLVTATSGTHHWLQEGFATYYALLAERAVFGDDYFFWKLYESALQLEDQDLAGKSTSLLDPDSSSLTFYQKGAWTLFMLRELVGDVVFRESVKQYLQAFKFKNVSTPDFMGFVEEIGDTDLTEFAYEWLGNDDFPIDRALDALKQNSKFIQEYLMVDCEVDQTKCHLYLTSGISDEAKVKIISQDPSKVTREVFKESAKVRQGIALYLKKIPADLKSEYESLLKDDSYITREAALYHLYLNFPGERTRYLEEVSGVSLEDYAPLRLLYIVFHLGMQDYQPEEKQKLLKEIKEATTSRYNVQTRIMAFNYIRLMGLCDEFCKQGLEEAKFHHNWRMVKFAKDQLSLLDQE